MSQIFAALWILCDISTDLTTLLRDSGPTNSTNGAIEYDNFKNNTQRKPPAPPPPPQGGDFKNFTQAQKEGQPIIKYIAPIVLTKCQEERETATEILAEKKPSSVPVLVPECEINGRYKEVQTDGNGFFWCVDPRRGEIQNGTRTYKERPNCTDMDISGTKIEYYILAVFHCANYVLTSRTSHFIII